MKRLILFACILFFNARISAQESKTFDINRNTIFFNEEGQQISFEDFSFITSNYSNTILPKFNDSGELEYVTLRYPSEANQFIGKTSPSKNTATNKLIKYSNQFTTNSINTDSYSNVNELEGWTAPDFSMLDYKNNEVSTEKYFGTVIVLKFWFSKCIPCLEEIPELNRLTQKYQNKNVVFYAPSVEKKNMTEVYINTHDFKYTTIYEAQKLAALYKTPGYPTHIVIGKDGRVRKVVVGKRTNIYKVLNEEIERALYVDEDDADVIELDDNENIALNNETVIVNESGEKISKEEYIYLMNTGRYKVFKKIKKTGKINLLITKK